MERDMQRRYLALWFPYLASERLRRRAGAGQDERPLVLVEKDRGALRLADCDRRAVALGLTRGLTLADARARIPELTVVEADPAADQRLIEWLAALCDRFTPLVALDPPHGLVLDITGCAHLFGGEAALRQRVGRSMDWLGLTVFASIAGTPQAARALSRFGRCAISLPAFAGLGAGGFVRDRDRPVARRAEDAGRSCRPALAHARRPLRRSARHEAASHPRP
jgi:protein ImuB